MALKVPLKDKTDWHNQALSHVRDKRDQAAHNVREWETLRDLASNIKDHSLSHLDTYLVQFEKKAKANGVMVHWAKDGDEHNAIVLSILKNSNSKSLVKSKSMLTEECGLNHYLEKHDIEVTDTDLGERIIQLKKETPSHIVMPAIHLKKEEIGVLFENELGTKQGVSNPEYLTEAARTHLRPKFLNADAALTGVNFGIAETGGIVVCTNEGNADMGIHSAPVQIHSMGIEKVIPQSAHMGVFTRLLARSATGQPITIYTSHIHRPRPNSQMHVIIVDNGRSEHLKKKKFRSALKCIRCGACMNTCPVYRRSGGHSYRATVPGPIGSIINPLKTTGNYDDLPFASSLCGSCSDICPVKIDIHDQLYNLRQSIKSNKSNWRQKLLIKIMGKTLSTPWMYNLSASSIKIMMRLTPEFILRRLPGMEWTLSRELPDLPEMSFRRWYQKNRKHG